VLRQLGEHAAVLAGGRLDRGHELLVLALRIVDERDPRLRDAGEPGDLARAVHAELDHRGSMAGPQAEDRQGHPDLVVEVAGRRQPALATECAGQDRREHLLDRGLAVAPGDRDHHRLEAPAPAAGEFAQCAPGVGHAQHRWPQAVDVALDHHGARPPLARGRGEVVPIEALAPKRDEELPGKQLARVGAHARDRLVAPAVKHADVEPVERLAQAERAHACPPSSRSASVATSTSEKRCLAPPTSWYVSWPLPAISTTSSGSAAAMARRIADARSSSTSQGSPAMPARIASAIAWGCSERGLSLVITTRFAPASAAR